MNFKNIDTSKGLYHYLRSLGPLTKEQEQQARKAYWRAYDRVRKASWRAENKRITYSVSKQLYTGITRTAELHRTNPTALTRNVMESYIHGAPMIPHRQEYERIIQLYEMFSIQLDQLVAKHGDNAFALYDQLFNCMIDMQQKVEAYFSHSVSYVGDVN